MRVISLKRCKNEDGRQQRQCAKCIFTDKLYHKLALTKHFEARRAPTSPGATLFSPLSLRLKYKNCTYE